MSLKKVTHQKFLMQKYPVIIYNPCKYALKVMVSNSERIEKLYEYSNPKTKFFIDGVRLVETQTFGFYHIKPNNIIIMINENSMNHSFSFFPLDSEIYSEKINSLINPVTQREAIRIRDLQLSKAVLKPKSFKKLINSQNLSDDYKTSQLTIPKLSRSPSVQPLPSFWGETQHINSKVITTQKIDSVDQDQDKAEQSENETDTVKP